MTELLFVTAAVIVWAIIIFNQLVHQRNRVQEGWSDIDVQLKLRHNLVPNLVSATKQYAKYEQAVLATVTELRNQTNQVSDIRKLGEIEQQLGNGLHKLVALVEQYPDLKANKNFTKLQNELVNIEEKIQYARRYYNGAVRDFNTSIERFPNLIVANIFNFKQRQFFQLDSDDMRHAVKLSN